MKLKLDLHDVYNRGQDIDRALRAVIEEAVAKKATLVEIIPGKGSRQLKERVLRILDQKEIKALYHRIEKDPLLELSGAPARDDLHERGLRSGEHTSELQSQSN